MRNIVYRPRAEADLDGIVVFLAFEAQAPQAATRVAAEIKEAIERLADVPTIGRMFEDEGLERSYRRFQAGSYWVYYSFDTETLTVWRILHISRDTDMFGWHVFDE